MPGQRSFRAGRQGHIRSHPTGEPEMTIEDIVNKLDKFFDRSPKGQDVWSKGYAPLKKINIRPLAKAIHTLHTEEVIKARIEELKDFSEDLDYQTFKNAKYRIYQCSKENYYTR